MRLRERIVLRLLGIRISADGTRWVAPQKRREIVERALKRICEQAWVAGKDVRISYLRNGDVMLYGPEKSITVRFVA